VQIRLIIIKVRKNLAYCSVRTCRSCDGQVVQHNAMSATGSYSVEEGIA